MKTVQIDSCWYCPYRRGEDFGEFCQKTRRPIGLERDISRRIILIPDWCPLPELRKEDQDA